jgi:hypothetical protein
MFRYTRVFSAFGSALILAACAASPNPKPAPAATSQLAGPCMSGTGTRLPSPTNDCAYPGRSASGQGIVDTTGASTASQALSRSGVVPGGH